MTVHPIHPHHLIRCMYCALGGKTTLAMFVRAGTVAVSCEAHKPLLPRAGMFARTKLLKAA